MDRLLTLAEKNTDCFISKRTTNQQTMVTDASRNTNIKSRIVNANQNTFSSTTEFTLRYVINATNASSNVYILATARTRTSHYYRACVRVQSGAKVCAV